MVLSDVVLCDGFIWWFYVMVLFCRSAMYHGGWFYVMLLFCRSVVYYGGGVWGCTGGSWRAPRVGVHTVTGSCTGCLPPLLLPLPVHLCDRLHHQGVQKQHLLPVHRKFNRKTFLAFDIVLSVFVVVVVCVLLFF